MGGLMRRRGRGLMLYVFLSISFFFHVYNEGAMLMV